MHPTLEALLTAAQETAAAEGATPTRFAATRAQFRGELRAANELGGSGTADMCAVALQLFVSEALDWFERWPSLDSIAVTSEITARQRMRADYTTLVTAHTRLTITLHGLTPTDRPHGDALPSLDGLLPTHLLGAGSCHLPRGWEQVETYLLLPESAVEAYEQLVWTLASHLATQFGQLQIAHEAESLNHPLG